MIFLIVIDKPLTPPCQYVTDNLHTLYIRTRYHTVKTNTLSFSDILFKTKFNIHILIFQNQYLLTDHNHKKI